MALDAVQKLLEYVKDGDVIPSPDKLSGTEEHRIRLTLHQVWRRAHDARADAALVEAHLALMQEAEAITDAALQRSFLTQIPENREIAALWEQSRRAAETRHHA